MKVKLQEALEALEGAGMETDYYYDTKHQEILMIFDGMVNGEMNPELIEDISDGFIEDYILLPGQYDIHEYRMMEEFIYELPAGRARDRLYDFGLEQKWYQYREEAYEKIARQWCERHKIDIVE